MYWTRQVVDDPLPISRRGMPFGLGDGLAANYDRRIGVILALNYLGRVVTSWHFTNKMRFW